MDNKERYSEERAAKFGLNMKEYSDENVAIIADFLYHCVWHDLFYVNIKDPADEFSQDVKYGNYDDMPYDEYNDLRIKFKQKYLLWDGRKQASALFLMEKIFKKCPKEEALMLLGDLVRHMMDPALWAVDINMVENPFATE